MTERFISVAEVLDRVGFSRAHLYRKINAGSFPRRYFLFSTKPSLGT